MFFFSVRSEVRREAIMMTTAPKPRSATETTKTWNTPIKSHSGGDGAADSGALIATAPKTRLPPITTPAGIRTCIQPSMSLWKKSEWIPTIAVLSTNAKHTPMMASKGILKISDSMTPFDTGIKDVASEIAITAIKRPDQKALLRYVGSTKPLLIWATLPMPTMRIASSTTLDAPSTSWAISLGVRRNLHTSARYCEAKVSVKRGQTKHLLHSEKGSDCQSLFIQPHFYYSVE